LSWEVAVPNIGNSRAGGQQTPADASPRRHGRGGSVGVKSQIVPEFCPHLVAEPRRAPRIIASGQHLEDETMKMAIALTAAAGIALAIPTAQADEARVGVGVGPVGAGVTVGESHERDRTTVIRPADEPRERTTIIKKEREEEPDRKVIIKEHDRD
jgi:hypothetical protein